MKPSVFKELEKAVNEKLIPIHRVDRWSKTDYLIASDLMEDHNLLLAAEHFRGYAELWATGGLT